MPRIEDRRRRPQRGFTLLEAIVAMVLLAGVGMAVFGWINGNLFSLERVRDANARSAATLNALEYMTGVNPMLTPSGEASLGAYRIRWSAEPASAVWDRAYAVHQVRLYMTRVAFIDAEGRAWFDVSLQQVGYKKVRDVSLK